MKFAQFVIGPAGVGKTRYCDVMRQHFEAAGRTVHLLNLDPAADELPFNASIDIRELVSLADVMEDPESRLGPNGGLVFCLEFLCQNMDWLTERLGDFSDDYLIIDCPGQIELYSHMPVMRQLIKQFELNSYRICTVYLLDSTFISDAARFISGTLSALSCMVRLEMTHVNVLTKMDQVKAAIRREMTAQPDWQRIADELTAQSPFSPAAASARSVARKPLDVDEDEERKNDTEQRIDEMIDDELERRYYKYFYCDIDGLQDELDANTPGKFRGLNRAMGTLLDDFSLVNFVPLDISSEHSIESLVQRIDLALQYGEDEDVHVPRDQEEPEEEE